MKYKRVLIVLMSVLLLTVMMTLASCNDKQVTVTFDSNGGSFVESQTVSIGDNVTEPNATKDGYELIGWYLSENKWSFSEDTVTEDIVLVAKWQGIYCTTGGTTHDYILKETVESTACNVSGYKLFECSLCQNEKTENTNLFLEHTYDNACDKYCNVCSNKRTVSHVYENSCDDACNICSAKRSARHDTNSDGICSVCGELILESWEKTLNVLVTRYGNTAGAPWGQLELNPSSFGTAINQAYLDRQRIILDTYGITVNYIEARDAQNVYSDIALAMSSKYVTYEIAFPRVQEAQSLVPFVYDMKENDIIDFKHSYFNQASYEAFTVADRTLFIAGNFDFMDEESSYALFVNKDMLVEELGVTDLYKRIRNGDWTYDDFKNLAKQVKADSSDGAIDDQDQFGYAKTNEVSRFYHYAGIKEAVVSPDTGLYEIGIDKNLDKITQVISNIIEINTSTDWARTEWGGYNGGNASGAFEDGRVLFYEDIVHRVGTMDNVDFYVAIIPFPKLNAEQDDYQTVSKKEISTVACIPKCTSTRVKSEFFIDALAKIGSETTMLAYYDKFEKYFDPKEPEEEYEILIDHVFNNITYDAGYHSSGWEGFLESIKDDFYANNTDNFADVFGKSKAQAEMILMQWNLAWIKNGEE